MFFSAIGNKFLPSFSNLLWTVNSAILLVFAFPDFDLWFPAYVALIPLFYAIEQEKQSTAKSFVLGWIWGICFFFGSCWWIAFPMKTYAGIPSVIAYAMALCVMLVVGLFPAIFAAIFAKALKRFGTWAILFAPFIWVFTEFLRFWLTGNNWNAIGYSQAFKIDNETVSIISIGGVHLVSLHILILNMLFLVSLRMFFAKKKERTENLLILNATMFFWSPIIASLLSIANLLFEKNIRQALIGKNPRKLRFNVILPLLLFPVIALTIYVGHFYRSEYNPYKKSVTVIAVQPNVPMSGLNLEQWKRLRNRHVELAENALQKTTDKGQPTIVIFPESPMNFEYAKDSEFREFIKNFATRNNVSVIFNAGEPVYPQYLRREPDTLTQEQIEKMLETYNSAVMVDEKGEKVAQFDKIHLLPFGEFIPLPKFLAQYVPPVVGNFTFGKEFDILNLGDAKAGVMICFESHFPSLSREYANRDADVLVEITNDGYLGNTPVLRQHLANAVFRAVETNRPVLRVTNVGITAYINERGEVIEPTEGYTEDTRIWTISKSDGKKTFYVKYGDWFAWLSSFVTIMLLFLCFKKNK
jgi:apolipoprotein N-acyltransferase